MDYEKEYKSLVAKVKEAHRVAQTDSTKRVLEDILPQLRESEDERIRKGMIRFLESEQAEGMFTHETRLSWIAYLEKQKDHFRDDTKMVEQKPADDKAFEEWIDDWWKHSKINNPDSYDKGDEIQFDEKGFKNFCRGIRNMYANQESAEWSEKDEKILDSLIRLYSREYSAYVWPWANGTIAYGDVVNFLKSLRPQSHWKPSREQMEALKRYSPVHHPDVHLVSLYDDLNKLM